MVIIKPSFEIWEQEAGLEGIYKQIERPGRTCYASDPIEGKAKDFVDKLIRLEHGAMLEHGTVYLRISNADGGAFFNIKDKYIDNKYSVVNLKEYKDDLSNRGLPFCEAFITTNYRVLVENGWLGDLQYLCESTEYHEKRVTVHFTTNIGVSREFNRHRVDSMAEQSTRYCGLNKFGNNLNINLPSWINPNEVKESIVQSTPLLEATATQYEFVLTPEEEPNGFSQVLYELNTYYWTDIDWWLWANKCAELAYLKLIEKGWSPQEARSILPLDTNTELIHTAFVSDWKHFFDLRALGTTGKPHPDAKVLAEPLMEEFKNRGLIS